MIFYFSGTGNSKFVAQKIAQGIDDNFISISDCLKSQELTFNIRDNEQLGFIFPTYFYGTPSIIADFVEKLKLNNYNSQYAYCITTCGQESGNLFVQFGKLLAKKGIKLNGASEVILPDNYILLFNLLPPKEKQHRMFIEAEAYTNTLITQIKYENLPIVKSGMGRYLKTKLMYPFYEFGRKTKHFYTLDTCNGCKLCENICPANIIIMEDNKPLWIEERCIQCLVCLHRCPREAIQHKKRTEKRDRYKGAY